MDRRKALMLSAAAVAAGGVGVVTLTTAFRPKVKQASEPKNLEFKKPESPWIYHPLDPGVTAEIAYTEYPNGSCMYGVFRSVIRQLADRFGEPFVSFPMHMMRYGHGGVNGSGTICGALNGAAALMGLFVDGKENQDILAAELFSYYENNALPVFKPADSKTDNLPTSVSESVLCHASTTRWGKAAGFRIDSKERKERCRRLTADVAARTVEILNTYYNNSFIVARDSEEVLTCMNCHGSQGKLANTSGKMKCSTCHSESLGHRLFGDVHYKLMKDK